MRLRSLSAVLLALLCITSSRRTAVGAARAAVHRRPGRARPRAPDAGARQAGAHDRGPSRRRGHRAADRAGAGDGGGGGLPVAQPGRGRPEPDRPRAGRGARPAPDRGAARRPPAGRRPAVLHPGLRLRLLQDPGRDLEPLAAGHDPQGRGADRPAVPAADHRLDLQRHAAGRPRPAPGGGLGGAGGVPRRGRLDPLPGAARARRGSRPGRRSSSIAAPGSTPPPRPWCSRAARSTARSGCPITRSRWRGGACTARRTWGGSRRSGPRRCGSRWSRTARAARRASLFAGIDTTLHRRRRRSAPADAGRRRRCSRFGGAGRRRRCRRTELAHLDRAIVAVAGVVCDARSDDDRVSPGQRDRGRARVLEHRRLARTRGRPSLRPRARHRCGQRAAGDPAARARARSSSQAGDGHRRARTRAARPRPTSACPAARRRCTTGARPRPPCAASRSGRRSSRGRFVLDGAAVVEREVSFRTQRSGARRGAPPARRSCRAWTWRSTRPPRSGPPAPATPRRFTVTLTHGARDTTAGTRDAELPAGWPAVTPQPFRLDAARTSARRSPSTSGRPPAPLPGTVTLRAVARDAAGRPVRAGARDRGLSAHPARVAGAVPRRPTVRVAPLRSRRSRGSATSGARRTGCPRRCSERGLPVTLLDAATLERGDLEPLRRHRRRAAGLRDRLRAGREQRAAAGLRPARRPGHRAVPAAAASSTAASRPTR